MSSDLEQAIDRVYASYLKAQPYLDYLDQDKDKRNPVYGAKLLASLNLDYKPLNILVTGSKGKGSIARILSRLLTSHYSRVGLFTSPHVIDFNERIQVNDKNISDQDLCSYISLVDQLARPLQENMPQADYLSPIGYLLAVAMAYFKDQACQVNILECGKGAKFDDVNQLDRTYSLIGPIFLEHTRELGQSLAEIARDKAMIIQAGQAAVYSARQKPEVMEIIQARADRLGVRLKLLGRDFSLTEIVAGPQATSFSLQTKDFYYDQVRMSLLGRHQAENAALAIQLCEDLIGPKASCQAVAGLLELKYPGRLETIGHDPLVILDACINSASTAGALDLIQGLAPDSVVTIIAVPSDKDYRGIARVMAGVSDGLIFSRSQNPHYHFSPDQAEGLDLDLPVTYIDDLGQAVRTGRKLAGRSGLVCVLATSSAVTELEQLGQTID